MADAKTPAERPLSPHLQIYKPMLTMMMSIFHRVTGATLYLGTILLAWWLIAAATGPDYFNFVNELFGSFIGRLVLFGFSWALFHHMLGGIRHLVWDTGRGFDLPTVEIMAWATLIGSMSLTVIIWVLGYMAMGAF
ncbi:succinate dehydrogenase cytochrome b556 subunit [bacterium MnTg02]|nr:succinate dehydrogenase cytochrome b556 subunit [bacterium MnTg02]